MSLVEFSLLKALSKLEAELFLRLLLGLLIVLRPDAGTSRGFKDLPLFFDLEYIVMGAEVVSSPLRFTFCMIVDGDRGLSKTKQFLVLLKFGLRFIALFKVLYPGMGQSLLDAGPLFRVLL